MPARRLLPCILGAALLTACTTTPDPLIDAPSTTPTPTTQALELGEFDPDGDFRVFDPCTEIPAEVLEEAGLGDPIDEPFYDGNRSAMCSFTALDEQRYPGVFSLVGDRNSKAKLEEQGLILGDMSTGIVPGGYLHLMPNDIENNCSAAVHTNRGRLIVRYTEVLSERDRQHYCDVASATLNSIYNQLGEIHGRFHRP